VRGNYIKDKALSQDTTTNDEDNAEEECTSKNITPASMGYKAPHYRQLPPSQNKKDATKHNEKVN
jgi:hypothetical protein